MNLHPYNLPKIPIIPFFQFSNFSSPLPTIFSRKEGYEFSERKCKLDTMLERFRTQNLSGYIVCLFPVTKDTEKPKSCFPVSKKRLTCSVTMTHNTNTVSCAEC